MEYCGHMTSYDAMVTLPTDPQSSQHSCWIFGEVHLFDHICGDSDESLMSRDCPAALRSLFLKYCGKTGNTIKRKQRPAATIRRSAALSQLLFRVYYHLIPSSKRRDVNECSHVQREAYVNVTSPDVPRLSEPELRLALSHILAASI